MGKKKNNPMNAIVYLSVNGTEKTIDRKEEKQLKYIKEYAKAHNIKIVKVMHRNIMGAYVMNTHFQKMVEFIRNKKADGILICKMSDISENIEDAYQKIGKVIQAGGHMITVDEGDLKVPLKMMV